jgi:beta-lactamase regulating signal transducer with metallopeptidase domain/HEAT repeat protein
MLSNILSNVAFSSTSLSMVGLLIKATLILVLAIGVTLSMQRASAGARHLVWLVTLATLLLIPALTAWAPIPLRILPAEKAATDYLPSLDEAPAKHKLDKSAATAAPTINTPATPVSLQTAIRRSPILSGLSLVVFIWALVVVAIASSLGYAAMLVKRIVNRARPLTGEDWLNPLYEVSDRLELEEPPRLLRSEDAKMPFACGVFTPTIVLPAECDTWTLDRRRAVLLHELAHVRRHDLVGHTLGRLACAFYWFHPLVWTAAKQLRSESERACDDLALACGARATDYAEHLLDIVTSVKRDATPSIALAMARRKEFEGRMLAILDPDLRHSTPSRRQSAALIGSLALISMVVGAAAPAPRRAASPNNVAQRESDLDLANQNMTAGLYPNPRLEKKMDKSRKSDASAQATTESATQPTQTSTTQQTLQAITTQTQNTLNYQVEQAVKSGTRVGLKFGLTVGQAAIQGILGNQAAKSDTDERPVLLAKILATDANANLRRIAAWGLSEYADRPVAADALANALRSDRDASVREMAAWSLAEGEHSAAGSQALIAALHDSDNQVRLTAAWALGSVGNRNAAEALAQALSDPSTEMRKRAAWALGNLDLKQAPPALINLLKDSDPETRETAAWALYEIEDPAAIPGLEAAMNREQDKDLQIAYIRALAAVGEKSVDALKSLLDSKDPEIRTVAVKALAGGHATGPWPRPWPQPRPYPSDR